MTIYGVSSGNGNDGVSHLFPDYYVRTDEPHRLARLAVVSTFKAGLGQAWAQHHVTVDGESEYTIYADISAPPCEDSVDGEYPESDDSENADDGRNWSEHNGSWLLFYIFPVNESELRDGTNCFDSLESAFDSTTLKLNP